MPKRKQTKTIILGEEMSPEHYPVLIRMAQDNLPRVEQMVQNLADTVYEGNVGSAMQALESDLEHSQ